MTFKTTAQAGRYLFRWAGRSALGLALLFLALAATAPGAQARSFHPAFAHAQTPGRLAHVSWGRARLARAPARQVARFYGRPAVRQAYFARAFHVHSRRFASRWPALSRRRVEVASRAAPAYGGSVIAEAQRFVGAGNVTGMRGPWCADYASMVLRRTGHRPLANRTASSALAYAPHVSQPRPGDLVVLSTRYGFASHVGFFAGWDHGRVLMISGNWGHRVARAIVYRGAVAAFIRV